MFIFSWIVGKLGSWLWPVIGLAALGLSLALGVQTKRLSWAKAETQQVRDAWTLDTAQRTTVALDAATKYRAREAELSAKVQEAQHDYTVLQADHARAIVASRAALAESGRLRGEIAAYAAGSGGTPGDACASDRDRAIALGQLLAEALRADAQSANDAEVNGDAVRALLSAWPK